MKGYYRGDRGTSGGSTDSPVALFVICALGLIALASVVCVAFGDGRPRSGVTFVSAAQATRAPTDAGLAAPSSPSARLHHGHHVAQHQHAHDASVPMRESDVRSGHTKWCRRADGTTFEALALTPCSMGSGVFDPDETRARSRPTSEAAPSAPIPAGESYGGGPVQVRGYYRRDGTFVHSYSRRR